MTKIDNFRTKACETFRTVFELLQALLVDDIENLKNLKGNEHFEKIGKLNQKEMILFLNFSTKYILYECFCCFNLIFRLK